MSVGVESLGKPRFSGYLSLVESPEDVGETNLDYAATTPALQAAVDAVTAFLPHYGSVHRGGGRRSRASTDAYEAARASVTRFVGCPADGSIVFVRNTTEAANVLASAIPAASRVLLSPAEHHANLLPWRSHRVSYLPYTQSAEELVAAVDLELAAGVQQGDPYRLLAVTGASNVTGEVTPIGELARVAHEHGTLIFVDAAQLAPHRAIDLRVLDVDFLAFSGHKLYAPFGTGALAIRDEAVRHGLPLMKGGGAVRLVTLDEVAWADAPHRYEAGTPNVVGAVALAAACEALTAVGMDVVAAHEDDLASRLWAGLSGIEGVSLLRLWPSHRDRVGVATFTIDGHEPHAVSAALASDWGIAIRSGAFCAHPLVAHLLGVDESVPRRLVQALATDDVIQIPGALRASVGLGTTLEDIDALLHALTTIIQVGA